MGWNHVNLCCTVQSVSIRKALAVASGRFVSSLVRSQGISERSVYVCLDCWLEQRLVPFKLSYLVM